MLPDKFIDRIFSKLSLTYGARFMRQYDGLDPDLVKANWAHELAGFAATPLAIKHALDHLPKDDPPNVLQFRDLCRGYRAETAIEALDWKPQPLPAPLAEKVADFMQAMRRKDGRAGMTPQRDEGEAA